MQRNLRHSDRGRRGFSLTEALVALLLVGLMGAIIVAGIPAARNVYNSMIRRENAEAVCTTITNRIAAELEDATEAKAGATALSSFVSHSGTRLDGMRIGIDSQPHTKKDGTTIEAVYVTYYDASGSAITSGTYKDPVLLLPEHTYVLGLSAHVTITPNSAKDPSSVELVVDVYYDDADKPLATQTVNVALVSASSGTSTGGGA